MPKKTLVMVMALLCMAAVVRAAEQGKEKPKEAEKKVAQFVDAPKTTKSHEVTVTVKAEKELLKEKEVWLAVAPASAPLSIWLQGSRLIATTSERTVFCGEPKVAEHRGRYQVHILTAPKGKLTREGEIKIKDVDSLGIEIIDSHTVERTE